MTEPILHHYAGSPFSEKVRLVLGFKRMSWRSVIVPTILPKPDVMALTGGYRRTPFLQIGADVYCDSALVCEVLDALQPDPPLYPAASAGLAEIVAQWADGAFFWTAVPFTMQPAGIAHVLKGATPEMLKAFGADRAAMNPNLRRPTVADGGAALHTYLERLERLLANGGPFLLGTEASIADVSVAQSIWFLRLAPPVAELLAAYPKVVGWFEAVACFGHGAMSKFSSEAAIAEAARGERVAVSVEAEPGLAPGAPVSVTPTDYAHDPVLGELVGLSRRRVTVARHDDRAGTVHVHFPRIGFQVKPQP